jgi:alpha-galactosidase
MMGKLGFDIPIHEFNEKELAFCQEAIKNYKRLSEVIWQGDQYRLISPYEENRAVLMYVNTSRDKSVLFSYTMNSRYGETFNKVRLQGLDPEKTYAVQEINQFFGIRSLYSAKSQYTGDYLMKVGLNVSTGPPLTSSVIEITAE